MDGWIKVYRTILEMIKNHNLFIFWMYCLLKASHKICKVLVGYQQIELLPGQFIFGRKIASKETGLTEREIRTCFSQLLKRGTLTSKPTNKYTVVTVVNWAHYQNNPKQNDHQKDQQATNRRPAGDHIQEWKNGRMEKKRKREREGETPSTPRSSLPDFEKIFDLFKKENQPREKAEAFYDYYSAHGTKMADWSAAVRNWIRREPAFKSRESRNPKQAPGPNYQQQVYDGSGDEEFLKKLRESGGRIY